MNSDDRRLHKWNKRTDLKRKLTGQRKRESTRRAVLRRLLPPDPVEPTHSLNQIWVDDMLSVYQKNTLFTKTLKRSKHDDHVDQITISTDYTPFDSDKGNHRKGYTRITGQSIVSTPEERGLGVEQRHKARDSDPIQPEHRSQARWDKIQP